tara:strand:- start:3321 stop:4415 length:1095 start_codon:yes stop_codon:yes gene_type:complete
MKIRKTSLYEDHKNLKGNLVNFSGFLLPTHYSSIKEEHLSVRETSGLFDVSHMGEIIISGPNSKKFLQFITTNNIDLLSYGKAQYSTICNDEGGILDDVLVYQKQNNYMMVVNASNKQKIVKWLNFHALKGIDIKDISDEIGLIAIQGPKSIKILNKIFNISLNKLAFYQFVEIKVNDIDLIISRTGYTGELGFELFINKNNIRYFWNTLLKKGSRMGLKPAGLGCRDTLRLEMKFSLYGNDLNEKINPIEAGLAWLVKFKKGNFIGRNALLKIKNTYKFKSICIEMIEKAIPRSSYQVSFENIIIGYVTSGTMSPSLGKGIAIAMINKNFAKIGNIITINIRGKQKKGKIVKSPFYKLGTMLN